MDKQTIYAGWGEADITPYGRTFALQGQARIRVTDQIHDPIYATVLALDTGEDCAVIISADLCYCDEQTIRQIRAYVAAKSLEIPVDKIFLHCVHVHTAPYQVRDVNSYRWGPIFIFQSDDPDCMQPEEYGLFLAEKIGDAVLSAWESRKKAGLASTLGYCALGHNRRAQYLDGKADMYGPTNTPDFTNIEGGEDAGVELLYIFDETGKPTGCIANCCCPAQVIGDWDVLSGELYAQGRREVWQALGEDFHLLPMCGAAGDLSPMDLIRRNEKNNYLDEYAGVIEKAQMLCHEIVWRLEKVKDHIEMDIEFAHEVIPLRLPRRVVTQTERDYCANKAAELLAMFPGKAPDDLDEYPRFLYYAQKAVENMFERQKWDNAFLMDMHVLRIGDTAMVTNPFELFLDFGQRIKGRAKAHHTHVVQLTGRMAGYLPTHKAIEGRGYSAGLVDGDCGPDAGDQYVFEAVTAVNRMYEAD